MLLPNTKFPNGTTMLQRVALVIWWLAATLAILGLIGFGAAILSRDDGFLLILSGGFAILCWATGRALFFILAGR
jgi:hypothetical protein